MAGEDTATRTTTAPLRRGSGGGGRDERWPRLAYTSPTVEGGVNRIKLSDRGTAECFNVLRERVSLTA
jgi:hypothetical protein